MDQELRQYILGELTSEEEWRLEERLMNDSEAFREAEVLIRVVEDELVDDYHAGTLSPAERDALETRLLHRPSMKEKLVLSGALQRLNTSVSPAAPWWQRLQQWVQPVWQPMPALTAAVVVVLLAGGAWTVVLKRQMEAERLAAQTSQARLIAVEDDLRADLATQRAANARLARQLASAQQEAAAPRPGLPQLVVATLLPGGISRSGSELARVAVGPDSGLVEFRLDLGLDEYDSYRAVLTNAAGQELLIVNGLDVTESDGTVLLVVETPSSMLLPDDYQFSVIGVSANAASDPIDRYPFRVVSP